MMNTTVATESGDTAALATELAAAMDDLAAALAEGGRDVLSAAVAEKIAAGRAYETKVRIFGKCVAEGGPIDPRRRNELARQGERLAALAAENQRRVRAAREANRRLIEALAEAAKAIRPGPGTYSRTDEVGSGRGSRVRATVALTVDRAL